MKITRKKPISSRVYIAAAVSAVAVALIAYAVFAVNTSNSDTQKPANKDKSTISNESRNNEATSDDPLDGSPTPSKEGYTDKPPTPEPSDSAKNKVEVNLTAKSQDTGPGLYRFRFNISTVATTGTCTLTLHGSDSTVVTKTASVFQAGASISTCQGFDVPLAELAKGSWQFTMIFENDELYGTTSGVAEVK